jgi:hypothetical protein
MIFQSRWKNAAYIVRPTLREVHPGYGVQIHPGLRAEFTGEQRIFDSKRSQEKYGWTDEERERVEKHLLKHKDYGNGIYLAPGEELPQEFEGMARVKPADKKATRCTFVWYDDGVIKQCEEQTMVGETRCSEHREDQVRITRGMAHA